MLHFLTWYRTRISQVFGLAFILLFIFSSKVLETTAPYAAGVLFMLGCILVGVATVGRMWCAQYIAGYKDSVLVREGPYSVCRNPLYFFSFLGCIGVGLCTESLVLTGILLVVFMIVYPFIIRSEEAKLQRHFGSAYTAYVQEVPRFFPDFRLYHEPKTYAVSPKVFRHAAFDVLWFIWAVGILECLEGLQEAGIIPLLLQIY